MILIYFPKCFEGYCVDSENGATDRVGKTCKSYQGYEVLCGKYDDDDFSAKTMCCVCKEALENGK